VAIQVASGQLTPRIIANTLLRNNVIRFSVGLFKFTFSFSVRTQARLDPGVTRLAFTLTVVSGIASVTAFLFLIDYTARFLRPIKIVWHLGEQGVQVIESDYLTLFCNHDSPSGEREALGSDYSVVEHRGTSGFVVAVNVRALVSAAQKR
jgi:uncharacterized membrane protein